MRNLELIAQNFLWNGKKVARISWEWVCSPMEQGDLGLRRFEFNLSLLHVELFEGNPKVGELMNPEGHWDEAKGRRLFHSNLAASILRIRPDGEPTCDQASWTHHASGQVTTSSVFLSLNSKLAGPWVGEEESVRWINLWKSPTGPRVLFFL
ncbi:hypothetical protein Droror1_Dr00028183 [Drosera rotundifolia]